MSLPARRPLVVVLLAGLLSTPLAAQQPRSLADSASYLDSLALDGATQGHAESVPPLVHEASAAYLALGDTLESFRIWYRTGYAAYSRPDTALTVALLQEGLRHPERADSASRAYSWYMLARFRRGPGAADSAAHDYQEALAFLPAGAAPTERPAILTNLGLARRRAGRQADAARAFEASLPLIRDHGTWPDLAFVLGELGAARESFGDPRGARAAYLELTGEAEVRADTARWVAALELQVAVLGVSLDAPDTALVLVQRALALGRAAGSDSLSDAMVFTAIGLGRLGGIMSDVRRFLRLDADSQQALGRPRAAAVSLLWLARSGDSVDSLPAVIALLRTADSLAEVSGDRMLRARVSVDLAEGYEVLGASDSARAAAQRALEVLGGRGGEDEASALSVLAGSWLDLGQVDSAIALARRHLAATRQGGRASREAKALEVVAHYLRARGTPAALREAIAYYDSATAGREAAIAGSGFEPAQALVMYDGDGGDFGIVMAWLGLGPTIGRAQAARGALLALERRRGLVVRRGRQQLAPLPTAEQALVRLRAQRTAVLAFAVKAVTSTEGELRLDSVITLAVDTAGRVHSWIRVVPRDSLLGMLDGIREACCQGAADSTRAGAAGLAGAGGPRRDPRGSLARLSRIILTPAVLSRLSGARAVVVEPDLLMSFAVFAAAPVGRDAVPFGVRYALRSVPILALGVEDRRAPAGARAVVVGNPTMPKVRGVGGVETTLAPLAGALAEARWVADRLGARILTGDSATESAVRRLLPGASIIHLATHGLAFRSIVEPRAPFIALAADSVEDGLLTVREILDDPALRLQADLVVLSACQSGLGAPGGEGLNGLQRAFLARGARSVLYSLWSVSDEGTALFMERFYTHWLEDRDRPGKSEALRRARADLRANPRFSAPRFWAAFQLAGED